MWRIASIAVGLSFVSRAAAHEPYTLFNPTPRSEMRPMSTDRPDVTESPYTVDAGHFQLEMSFAEWSFKNGSATEAQTDELRGAPFLAKVGLLENIDLQFGLEPYVWQRSEMNGDTVIGQGLGDSLLRLKVNLYGNNDESPHAFAIAVMPAIKIPTASRQVGNGEFEFAMIVPIGLGLGSGWDLGAMAEFDLVTPNDDNNSLDFVHTATLGKEFTEELGAFVEYAGIANFSQAEPYRASLDIGTWLQVNANLKYDAGVRLGLTDATDGLQVFAGVSFRY
ncbi:MAG: transporter [Phycisphaerales bacterium]